jgi:hypothetical protein
MLANPSLQRTRLRRAITGRRHSQAFGLAIILLYHRRAAELNRWAAWHVARLKFSKAKEGEDDASIASTAKRGQSHGSRF